MSGRDLPSPLLAVTDRHGHSRPLAETVQAVLDGGCRWVWFRERDMACDARRALAEEVLFYVRAAGGHLCVGGDPDLAEALGADSVHLAGGSGADAVAQARRRLWPDALVGVSCHSPADVAAAAAAGANYATLSPIFETASKPGYGPALGSAAVRAASGIALPVVALGGIAPQDVSECRAAGAAGIAIMGGLMRANDPAAVTRRCLDAWGRRQAGL